MKKNIFKNNNLEGYTLIEMIVSVAIIATISSIIIANIGEFRRGGDVHMAAQLLASDIRVAQGHALSIKKHRNDVDTASPVGSWGIFVSQIGSNYYLFGDLNLNGDYDGGNERFSTLEFPGNIKVDRIMFNNAGNFADANILFEPPAPDTVLNNSGGASQATIQIELIDESTQRKKTVEVNEFGLVDVQN